MGVRVALYPTLAASVGMQAAWHVLHDFKLRGLPAVAEWQAQMRSGPHGVPSFAELTGLPKVRELEASFIPAEHQRDYDSTWGHRAAHEEPKR